ncbi:ribosomal protein L17 [Atractiella rhizophila]|nr:ribosomal protein L17 [Atractiella rhizophila]
MRHRVAFSSLGRPTAARIQLFRNMISSLIMHDQISTTVAKAKQVQPLVEKVLTAAKRGKHVKVAQWTYAHEATLPQVFRTLLHRYSLRKAGYTRLHRLPPHHHDQSPRAILELVDNPKDLKREKVAGLIAREMIYGWAGNPKDDRREEELREITGFLWRVEKGEFGEKEAVALVERLMAEPRLTRLGKAHQGAISEETRQHLIRVFRFIPKTKEVPKVEFEKKPLVVSMETMMKEVITDPTDARKQPLSKPYSYGELALAFLVRTWRHSLRIP